MVIPWKKKLTRNSKLSKVSFKIATNFATNPFEDMLKALFLGLFSVELDAPYSRFYVKISKNIKHKWRKIKVFPYSRVYENNCF